MQEKALQEFRQLLETADRLLGPGGCPWDREQTLVSMRSSILEEACEVIEAIDEEDDPNLIEELGDLLYNVLFFCKLAEKEGRFSLDQPIAHIREKLIARHPHVFGEHALHDTEAVLEQWERLKKEEKSDRESVMDGIPKGLPSLARAHKIAGKMERAKYETEKQTAPFFASEEELGEMLFVIAQEARKRGINPENALRKELMKQEKAFRKWEGC